MAMRHVPRTAEWCQAPHDTFVPQFAEPQDKQWFSIAPMDYKRRVGERIRAAREDLGLRLVDLSQRTGGVLTVQRINAYENGDRMPKQAEAVILAKALGKTAAYLLALNDSETPMTATEERLLRNWRTLNERDRMEIFRQVEALAMANRDPVQDRVVERHLPIPKTAALKRVKR